MPGVAMRRSRLAAMAGCMLLVLAKPWSPRAVPVRERQPVSWDITIARPQEPGDPMVLTGRVLWPNDTTPCPGATVYVYHADARGYYGLPGDSGKAARLAGILRTNARGEYRVRTILPGMYEGAPHVHFEVWGEGIDPRALFVNIFKAEADSTEHYIHSWRVSGSGSIVVRRDSLGVWRGRWDLHVSDAHRISPDTTGGKRDG